MSSLLFTALMLAALSTPPGGPGPGLLIVAPRAWCSELRTYAKARHKDLPCRLKALEDILSSSKGVDEPEKLEQYFYGRWKKRELGYVLLVGDVDVMPVRFMVLVGDPSLRVPGME